MVPASHREFWHSLLKIHCFFLFRTENYADADDTDHKNADDDDYADEGDDDYEDEDDGDDDEDEDDDDGEKQVREWGIRGRGNNTCLHEGHFNH